ncbi:MAG: hypothetical protein P8X57_09490 [Cyclobacteriaceae bacterium]
MIPGLLLILAAVSSPAQQLQVIAESSIYISGDPVRMQMVILEDDNTPLNETNIVTSFLVSSGGTTMAQRRFMITPLEKGAVFLLPPDLETGRYKLISVIDQWDLQNEITINVYAPSIFSSASAPKNADTNLGVKEQDFGAFNGVDVRITAGEERGSVVIPALAEGSTETGVSLVHVFHESYDELPVIGKNNPSRVGQIELDYELKWLTDDPNSRISFYFLEQGLVEEYYLADGDRIFSALQKHYGGGPVWAFQFDGEGNRLGQVDVQIGMSDFPEFSPFTNTVPYNEKVRNILENKRIRKYVDQVYHSEGENTGSILDEEFDMTADATVRPERYEGYATLKEALANIVPKTQVIRRSGDYEIRLSPSNSGFRYPESPLLLINGVPTYQPDSLMDLTFSDLERISIYNSLERLRRFGTLGRFGVVEIQLKPGVENPLEEFRSSLPVMRGISDVVISSPGYDDESPDLRSNVLWDPSVRIYLSRPNDVSWKMSDLPGTYRVLGIVYLPGGEQRYFSQQFNHLYR